MTNIEFFNIVKNTLKEYFYSNGFTKCKIYKGRRNSVCFEKKVEFYTVYVEFCWDTYINDQNLKSFSIGFGSFKLLFDKTNLQSQSWLFKTEDELKKLLSKVPENIAEQDYFDRLDKYTYRYFHRNKES